MSDVRHIDEWKREVFPALLSKKEELQLMGYSEVTIDEISVCLEHYVWQKDHYKKLYEIVQDIMHLPSHTYMNYLTMNVLQNDTELADTVASLTDLMKKEPHDEE